MTTPLVTSYLPTAGASPDPQFNGVYDAQVAVTADPLNVGRVELYIPQVLGTALSNWAMPMQPGITPATGTSVLVVFLGGNINLPYYFVGVSSALVEAVSGSSAVLNSNAFFVGGLLTGWTATNGTLTAVTPNSDTNPPFPYGALWTGSGTGGGYISESPAPFAAVIGSLYLVQAWVYYPVGGSVNIGAGWTGQANTVTPSTVTAGTWTYVSAVVTATATTGWPLVGPVTSTAGQQFTAEAVTVTGQVSARQIGGITTTIGPTAPSGALVGDLWFDNAGTSVVPYQYSGSTWNLYQYGTGAIAANSVTANQIAANTITAGQIQAGTLTGIYTGAAYFGQNMIQDPAFSSSLLNAVRTGDPMTNATWTLSGGTAQVTAGTPAVRLVLMPSGQPDFFCTPGEQFYLSITATTSATCQVGIEIVFNNGIFGTINQTYHGTQTVTGTVTVPAGASYGYIQLFAYTATGSPTATFSNPACYIGQLLGPDWILSESGFFQYTGTPASGNLYFSSASVAGSDIFGNTVNAGLNIGLLSGAHFGVDLSGTVSISNGATNLVTISTTGTTFATGAVTFTEGYTVSGGQCEFGVGSTQVDFFSPTVVHAVATGINASGTIISGGIYGFAVNCNAVIVGVSYFGSSATFANGFTVSGGVIGGTITLASGATFSGAVGGGAGTGLTFNNNVIFTAGLDLTGAAVTFGAGGATFNTGAVNFENGFTVSGGTIGGTLTLASGATFSGAVGGGAGTGLTFNNNVIFTAGLDLTGAAVTFGAGGATFNTGAVNFENGFTVSGGTVNLGTGVSGFTVVNGSGVTNFNDVVNFTSAGSVNFTGDIEINSGGSIILNSGATLQGVAGGGTGTLLTFDNNVTFNGTTYQTNATFPGNWALVERQTQPTGSPAAPTAYTQSWGTDITNTINSIIVALDDTHAAVWL